MKKGINLIWLCFIGAIALFGIACLTVAANRPNLMSPFSLIIAIPALIMHGSIWAQAILPTVFFFYMLLIKDSTNIPLFTKIWAIIAIVCSAAWLVHTWSYAIKYHGASFTIGMSCFNLVSWMLLYLAYNKCSKNPSYMTNFIFHWLLFAWLAWAAFPWLGETP